MSEMNSKVWHVSCVFFEYDPALMIVVGNSNQVSKCPKFQHNVLILE